MPTSSFRLPSFTAVVSLVFAATGFSNNTWRLENQKKTM